MFFLLQRFTSPVSWLDTGVLARKLPSGNWKLFLGSQLPFYFHLCVWEDEIPVRGGRPTGVSAGGCGQGLASCWCSADSEERDTSQRRRTLWQSCFLALELGSFARIRTARVNLWETGRMVSPQGGLFYFMVGVFFPPSDVDFTIRMVATWYLQMLVWSLLE